MQGMFGLFKNRAGGSKPSTDRRLAERFAADMLTCPVGKVVDMSATGMSLTSERKPTVRPGQVGGFPLMIGSRTFNLYGRVLRVNRRGMKGYDIGVVFINPDPRVVHILTSVARFGFVPKDGVAEDEPKAKAPQELAGPDAHSTAHVNRDPAGIYRLLGVPHDASDGQINDAFRQLARQYHPDLNRAADAQEQFIAIKQAYDLLRDPDRRQRYDRVGAAETPSAAREHAGQHANSTGNGG